MTEDTLIDDQSLDVSFHEEVQQKNKKYIKWAVFFAVLNTALYSSIMFEMLPSIKERFNIAFQSNLIGLPMLCFLLGLLLAFIPYRGLTWRQKYKRASLLTLLTCDIIMTIGLLLLGLATLYKYSVI